ncbi:MAG TPA: restriction endonuclease subunit S [Candidatus Saccharibacteria bacterium]|nr:restriction endonuclease subunit S [Candidatus Saccharibacteria bacterium]
MTVKDLRTLVDSLEEYIHVPGGIERLKKTILHLAVSGKLVPQDPFEGTGEELYKQIQVEKQKRIAEGKVKKQKPLLEIANDEIPFEIPQSWKWVRPQEVGQINPRNYVDDSIDIGFIPMTKVSEKYGAAPKYEVRKWIEVKKNFTHFADGDVVLAKITPCFENSKAGIIVSLPNHYGAGTTELHVFRQDSKLILPKYSYLWFKNPTYLETGKTKMTGSAGQKRVSTEFFANFPMPLPPSSEQLRIVEKVDAIFALIDELAEKYVVEQKEREMLVGSSLAHLAKGDGNLALKYLLEIIRTKSDAAQLRKTILHLAVSGQLVPQDPSEGTGEELFAKIQAEKANLTKEGKLKKQKPLSEITESEVPFQIPKTWKWARLGEISNIFNGNSINASEKKLKYEKVAEGYPYLGTKDIGYGFDNIDYDNGVKTPYDEGKFTVIPKGTVLICSEGGSAGKKCGIVDRDVTFGNKMYAFNAYGNNMLPDFVLYNYLTKHFHNHFIGKMTGIIGGISVANFKELIIPLPPQDEQIRIVQKTTQLLDLVDELEKHLER